MMHYINNVILYVKYVLYIFVIYLGIKVLFMIFKIVKNNLSKLFIYLGITKEKKTLNKMLSKTMPNGTMPNGTMSNEINNKDKIEILMDKFGIKSTERTKINLKYVIDKPSHLNVTNTTKMHNNSDMINIFNDDFYKGIEQLQNDEKTMRIMKAYIYNKYMFSYFFGNDDGLKIKDLSSFYEFHKRGIMSEKGNSYNILLKFYNNDMTYLYIFVNSNNLIKIKSHQEYDKLCELFEYNNNIFLIRDDKGAHYITHGSCITQKINEKEIKSIFFRDTSHLNNKNYDMLCQFENVKIYFYTSTKIYFDE